MAPNKGLPLAPGMTILTVTTRTITPKNSTSIIRNADVVCFLSPRENEVLQLVRRGRRNKEIARELGLELSTAKGYVHALLVGLRVHSRVDLATMRFSDNWPGPVHSPGCPCPAIHCSAMRLGSIPDVEAA